MAQGVRSDKLCATTLGAHVGGRDKAGFRASLGRACGQAEGANLKLSDVGGPVVLQQKGKSSN